MAGYSATTLVKKLGIKETSTLLPLDAPEYYFELLGTELEQQVCREIGTADIIHVFVKNRKSLEGHFYRIIASAKNDAVVWISWYKKASKIATDVTEDVIRDVVLPTGWVDIKVCAVSDVWSGLKVVKRVANRL